MSYSRWINSEFYTFWSGSGASKKEDEQFCCMFSLDSSPHFSYTEIKEMIENPKLMYEKIIKIFKTYCILSNQNDFEEYKRKKDLNFYLFNNYEIFHYFANLE